MNNNYSESFTARSVLDSSEGKLIRKAKGRKILCKLWSKVQSFLHKTIYFALERIEKYLLKRQEGGPGQDGETGVDFVSLSLFDKDRKVLTQKAGRWSGEGRRDRC